MNRLALLLAVGWPPLSVQAGGRFAVMTAVPTLSPRYYQAAFPASDTLGKRQAECESGRHPCKAFFFLNLFVLFLGETIEELSSLTRK